MDKERKEKINPEVQLEVITLKKETDIKVEELPLDLSMPKMNEHQHGEMDDMHSNKQTTIVQQNEEPVIKQEPEVSVSDVTYISDDDQNKLEICTDEPALPNSIMTQSNTHQDIDSDSNFSE